MRSIKIITFLLVCLLSSGLKAEASETTLVLELSNGTIDTYALSDRPVITFDRNELKIESNEIFTTYNIKDVNRYYFDLNSSAIDNIVFDDNSHFYFYIEGENICVKGATRASVYSMNGNMLAEGKGDGEISISLSSFPSGFYIINVNNKTIKIKK